MFPATPFSKVLCVTAIRLFLLTCLLWYIVGVLASPGTGSVICNVSFPPGSGIHKLAYELKAGGVIRSSWHFVLMTRLRGDAHRLKAGEYHFTDGMTPDEILNKIVTI